MDRLSKCEIWYGRDCAPPEVIRLRAGPLALEFQEGDLRYIRLGECELVRRIYVGIRDHNWNTIPGQLSDLKMDTGPDRFRIAFNSHHVEGALDFSWTATITGDSDGTVNYALDGIARREFRYCRMGFCLLHPTRECDGRPYRAETPGGPVSGTLPSTMVEPQLMENDLELPLFPSFSSLTVTLANRLELHTEFEGDLFEMEDQRNWTDDSLKTYCTPIALGYPHTAAPGQTFHQKITIRASHASAVEATAHSPLKVLLGEPTGRNLPRIGVGQASHGQELTAKQAELLSKLRPAHLKAEVHLADPQWMNELDAAMRTAQGLGTPLELALFLGDDVEAGLAALRGRLAAAPLARLLVFHESDAAATSTRPCWVDLVRERLGGAFPGLAIGGGTNGNFAELNRARPNVRHMDAVSFTMNPQVHASDERSLVEALSGQEDAVRTARSFCGTLPICVSSVTLKPPFNQAATEEEAPPRPGELPAAVDARQMSLFAAAWTVGSIAALTRGGADAITYYETTGWRGLMETDDGSPLPNKFRSRPGMVFPVYHVLADVAEAGAATVVATMGGDPLRLATLALNSEDRLLILVANLEATAQQVVLGSLPGGAVSVRRLNEDTASLAMFDAERFRQLKEPLSRTGGGLLLNLKPYEIVRVDVDK